MKNSTRNKVNLIFSSFLVIGYIVCSFFFSALAKQVGGEVGSLIQAVILVLFGLLLFYATRVGEGKQVKRFSIAVLLLLVLPCAYIIAASFLSVLPFHDQLAPVTAIAETGKSAQFQPVILMLACIGLGYGIPYTFLSGYELNTGDNEEEAADEAPAAVEEAAEKVEEAVEKVEEVADQAEEVTDQAEETAEKAEEAADQAEEVVEKVEEVADQAEEAAEKAEEVAEKAEEVAEKVEEAAEKAEEAAN